MGILVYTELISVYISSSWVYPEPAVSSQSAGYIYLIAMDLNAYSMYHPSVHAFRAISMKMHEQTIGFGVRI